MRQHPRGVLTIAVELTNPLLVLHLLMSSEACGMLLCAM